ncbi:hypothetical protein ABPG74_018533 [Tetrahymena malaccensis]
MADNNDDLFGQVENNTQQNDVHVEDIEDDDHYNQEDHIDENDVEKQKELRKKKKEVFVKRYLMEKEWWKEEQRKIEEQKRKEQELMKKRMQQFTNADQLSILEKYEAQDQEDEFFKPITKFKGPTSDRVLTNKYCIYLWIVLNGFFIFASIYVLSDGRPARLGNGYDFRTELCGNGKYVKQPYLYYLNPVQDIRVAMCVSSCPTTSGPLICLYDTSGKTYDSIYTKFCYTQMQSSIRSKYCVPNEPINGAVVNTYLESFDLSVKRYASDIMLGVDIMLCGAVLTVILSFLFLYFLKNQSTVSCFVSLTFLLILMCCGGLAFLFYREYVLELQKNCFTLRDENNCVGSRGYSFRSAAISVIVLAGLYVILLMILSKRIVKIVGFLKLASQVVQIMQQIKWIPFYVLLIAIFIAALTLINVPFGLSVADVVVVNSNSGAISGGKLKVMEFSGFAYFIGFYDFFIFIIWMLFLLGFRDLFVSYSITLWFFTKRKDTVQIPKWVIFKNIFRYHFGTVVMFSLISTVITIPKIFIMALRRSLRSLPQYLNSVRYFQATCNCCLFSYEKFLRYFSKSSLVQVAITSMEFYPSSKIAYFLIFRNKEKISDMDGMQQFVVSNIKFLISFTSFVFVYAVLSFINTTPLTNYNTSEIENKFFPGLIVGMFSYFFSSIFLGSYDITCKSVIQCYLIDQEIFYGENRYVEPFIKNVFEYYVQEDLEKYKIQSKAGVNVDENKVYEKEKSDDEKAQIEEEDSQESDEEEFQKNKKNTAILNDNTATTKLQTATGPIKPANGSLLLGTKPNTNTLNTQSNFGTPQRLITDEKTGFNSSPQNPTTTVKNNNIPNREQELVNLNNSNDSDDYNSKNMTIKNNNNNSSLAFNQSNFRINTAASNQQTPVIAAQPNKITPTTIQLTNLQNINYSSSGNNYQTQLKGNANNQYNNQRPNQQYQLNASNFNQYRDNTAPIMNQSRIPSQSNMFIGNTQPMSSIPSQTNFMYNGQRVTQPSMQNIKQSQQMFTNNQQNDDDDDNEDDFGLGANPYATVDINKNNSQRYPNRNEMRLLNASYASSGVRGVTGQSNASKVSKVSKASFDPFVQFQQNQLNVDSDEEDDD